MREPLLGDLCTGLGGTIGIVIQDREPTGLVAIRYQVPQLVPKRKQHPWGKSRGNKHERNVFEVRGCAIDLTGVDDKDNDSQDVGHHMRQVQEGTRLVVGVEEFAESCGCGFGFGEGLALDGESLQPLGRLWTAEDLERVSDLPREAIGESKVL